MENRKSLWGFIPAGLAIAIPTMMQVGPDDAVINLCKWPRKAFPALAENCLPGISANELYVLAIILFTVGVVWLTRPYRLSGTLRKKMVIGLTLLVCGCALGVVGLSIIAAGDGKSTTKIATSSPPPNPPPSPPLAPPTPPAGPSSDHSPSEPDQTGARIAVWQSINRQMDELSKLLNAGYSMLDSWPQNAKADREKEIRNWQTLDASFEALRAKLDRLRDSYDNQEVSDVLQPVTRPPGRPSPPYTLFHSLSISVEAFLAELRSAADPIPEAIEDDMRAHSGLILRDLSRLAKWKSDTKNTSGIRVNELSVADPPRPTASSPFDVGNQIYRETRSIKTTAGRDTKPYETAFYLVVSNNSVDGGTMRNVQAEIVGYETPVVASVRGSSADRVDLKHGQAAFFLIGKTIGGDFSGNFVGDTIYVPDKLRRYVQNIASSRKPTFEVWSYDNVYRYGLNDDKEKMDWPLTVVVSADDRKSKQVALTVRPIDQIPINYAEGK